MNKTLLFLFFAFSLSADLYDRNKYDMDFRPQEQPLSKEHSPQRENQPKCPCAGDPQCPCQTGPNGEYYRVD